MHDKNIQGILLKIQDQLKIVQNQVNLVAKEVASTKDEIKATKRKQEMINGGRLNNSSVNKQQQTKAIISNASETTNKRIKVAPTVESEHDFSDIDDRIQGAENQIV